MISKKPLFKKIRDAARYRSRPLRGWLKHGVWRRFVKIKPGPGPIRLHVGSGMERLEGWINLDIQRLPEVDYALDVTRGFPFSNVESIFAEHFLEHLPVGDALEFLLESNRILGPEGWIRLSTPNLDWVWSNVYRLPGAGEDPEEANRVLMGLHANRAFYAWDHRFLWNRPLLLKALRVTGFRDIRWCRYGESSLEAFRGIERHATYDDTPEIPHVLIAEGRRGPSRPDALRLFREQLQAEFLQYRGT